MASKPSAESSRSARAIERSACSAWNPRDRKNPVIYAVDGYGVFSWVMGGIMERIRTEDVILRGRAVYRGAGGLSRVRWRPSQPLPRETVVGVNVAAADDHERSR